MSGNDFPQLPPSGIGEAARYDFSPWFIKLRFQDTSPIEGRRWNEATKPLSTLQATIGDEFEKSVYETLSTGAYEVIDTWHDWGNAENEAQIQRAVEEVATQDEGTPPTILTQARLSGSIEAFDISGDADLVLLFPTGDGVHIHVIDIKASWDEKPYQQLQAATYSLLLRDVVSDCDVEYSFGGGIIYRETDMDSVLIRDETPSFHLETREGDVHRILRNDGPFTRAFESEFESLPLTAERTSPYAEVTVVECIESGDLSLLDLSPGEQSKLNRKGIEDIGDVAELYDVVEDAKPYDYTEPSVNNNYQELVAELKEDSELATRLSVLAQRAQALLGDLNPEHAFAHDKPWFPWLQGVGPAQLPEDDPPYNADLPIQRNGLIRCYLNVQYDHVRDCVAAISGRIDCGLYDRTPLTFNSVIKDIDRNSTSWGEYEADLLEDGLGDLFQTIQMIGNLTNQRNAGVHFYFYGNDEYDALYEAVREHKNTVPEAAAMCSLLDSRAGIDQSMVSVVETELDRCFATKQFDMSLPAVVERMYPNDENAEIEDDDWVINHKSGVEIDLQDAFEEGLFDTLVPLTYEDDGTARVLTRHDDDSDADSFTRLVPRSGAQIPIEYLWACDEVSILDKTWTEDDDQESLIESFSWVDRDVQNMRISRDLFGLLSSKLTHALHHVERSITYRSTDVEKEPLDLAEINNKHPSKGTLADACREYLDLESHQQKQDAYDVYMQPAERRILDGESVPIRITDVLADEGYMFKAEGELLFEEFGFENPRRIAGSSRVGGSDGSSGGDRCVATPIEKTAGEFSVDADGPRDIARSVKVSVDTYEPNENRIVVSGYRASSDSEYVYTIPRPAWTTDDPDSGQPYIGPNETFLLDPSPDSSVGEKALKALRHADANPVYQDITRSKSSPTTDFGDSQFTDGGVGDYVDWASDALEFKPNKKQQEFIEETSRYSLLQGPPGTGKTSGATAQALLSRAYDAQQRDERVSGLVAGLSNKSVDEVLEDVANMLDKCDTTFDTHCLENVRLVRLAYDKPDDGHDRVEYLRYHNDEERQQLHDMLLPTGGHQQRLGQSKVSAKEHVLVFATPGRVDGLMKYLLPGADAEVAYENAYNLFDVVAVDEASMMPLYQLLMTSAFLKDDGQVMVAGDHRQLPPVQQYEWMDETRTSIVEHLPYLSVLDYFRYMRGDVVETVPEEAPPSPQADIPIVRLNETFRCHSVVTEFLRKTVYEQDEIDYTSEQTERIDAPETDLKSIETALDPESPLTVIVHDDRRSRQVSRVEATMLSALTGSVPSGTSTGIVTPHNAQKGRLNVVCDYGDIDTVERFQGGEKDIMFLSTTVSDPAHLSDEEEFILSQSRLNVALSRMKKKLVVLVPASIFELVPDDIDVYDEALIWKSLYATAAADTKADWEGTVGEFTGAGDLVPGANVSLRVYNVSS